MLQCLHPAQLALLPVHPSGCPLLCGTNVITVLPASCCVALTWYCLLYRLQDEEYEAMVVQYNNCLVQANELVTAIQRHITSMYTDITNMTLFWHVDKLDWGSFRLAHVGLG